MCGRGKYGGRGDSPLQTTSLGAWGTGKNKELCPIYHLSNQWLHLLPFKATFVVQCGNTAYNL